MPSSPPQDGSFMRSALVLALLFLSSTLVARPAPKILFQSQSKQQHEHKQETEVETKTDESPSEKIKTEPTKSEPTKTEPTKTEPTKSEPINEVSAESGVTFANPVKNRWRVGAKMRGGNRSVKNMLITIPVPTEWPEQEVRLHNENFPIEVQSADYRDLNSGVRQLVLKIPKLKAKQLIEIDVTFDVTISQTLPPADTSQFKIPKRIPKEIKDYIGVSPQISYRNAKLRKQVKDILAEKENAWDQVEAIFDWVRENIEYRGDEPSDALTVFRKRSGCSEDLVGLFVAMCRAGKIPARMVWVDGAQYAEFHLVDAQDRGHWFPCHVAGRREFGANMEPKVIQQKGDNIKVPEKKERQKFCA